MLMIILTGCMKNEVSVSEKEDLNRTIEDLQTELKDLEIKVEELSAENEHLKEIEEKYNKAVQELQEYKHSNSRYNVFKDKMFVASTILSQETLSIEKVKELLGEPNKVETWEEAHGGPGQVIQLFFDEGTFIFGQSEETGKVGIKSYTVKDDLFKTSKGISIGSKRLEVINAYKEVIYEEYKDSITLGEKTGMSFKFKDDIVSEISVWFEYE